MDQIAAALDSSTDEATIDRALLVLSTMPSAKVDTIAAETERKVWHAVLTDEEMSGRIPAWVVQTAVREHVAGQHGRWMPSVGDFLGVCKSIIARHQYAIVIRRNLLDAPVRPEITEAARASMLDRMRMLVDTIGAAPKRKIEPDDGWEARRASVMSQMEAMR